MEIKLVDYDGSFFKLVRGDILKIDTIDIKRDEFPNALTTTGYIEKNGIRHFVALLSYSSDGIMGIISRRPKGFNGETIDIPPYFSCATFEININIQGKFERLGSGAKGHFELVEHRKQSLVSF